MLSRLLLLCLALPAASFVATTRSFAGARAAPAVRMGVMVKTTKAGDGKTYPQAGQMCKVHYTGKLTDGTTFDSSRGFLKFPFEFQIGAGDVIKGWDKGVIKMSKGEKATLTCAPDFGYGSRGALPDIPPGATLVFDVELIAISGK